MPDDRTNEVQLYVCVEACECACVCACVRACAGLCLCEHACDPNAGSNKIIIYLYYSSQHY